jgi:hypothetical protein
MPENIANLKLPDYFFWQERNAENKTQNERSSSKQSGFSAASDKLSLL